MKLIVYIAAVIIQSIIFSGLAFSTCNEKESCIKLHDCPKLSKILQQPQRTYLEAAYVASKQCGYENTKALACCEIVVGSRSSFTVSEPESMPKLGRGNILPSSAECGRQLSNRIVGGRFTHMFEFPWMAMLEYEYRSGRREFLCGGTLLNHRYVLTAGHCIAVEHRSLIGVRLGEWDRTTNPDCEIYPNGKKVCSKWTHANFGIEETFIHENYDYKSRTPHNDIALIRLSQEVEYNDIIRPICLPKASLVNELFIGATMDVAGWGFTENHTQAMVKTKAEVRVWSLDDCRIPYRNISLVDSQLCAGGEAHIDACAADSGGPLVTIFESKYVLAGVVSYGPVECGTKGVPGVYTRVTSFRDWIVRSLKP